MLNPPYPYRRVGFLPSLIKPLFIGDHHRHFSAVFRGIEYLFRDILIWIEVNVRAPIQLRSSVFYIIGVTTRRRIVVGEGVVNGGCVLFSS